MLMRQQLDDQQSRCSCITWWLDLALLKSTRKELREYAAVGSELVLIGLYAR
jgi:hypothetical protein